MITERHSGKGEKSESFSGMRFRIKHSMIRTLKSAREKAKMYQERGFYTRIERENRLYRVYIRRK